MVFFVYSVIVLFKLSSSAKLFSILSKSFLISKVKKPFKVQLTDIKGKPVVNQTVVFKINGKKYKRVTDEEGIASINIKLKKGTYKIKYKFYKVYY